VHSLSKLRFSQCLTVLRTTNQLVTCITQEMNDTAVGK